MKKFLKLAAAMLFAVAVVYTTGCKKSSDNNDNNNSGGGGGTTAGNVTVTTYNPTDISSNEATCGVEANPDDINYLEEIGVCWGTSAYPTVNNNKLSTGNCDEPFVCIISNLQSETIYHVRGYALYNGRYYYGDDKSFTTTAGGGGGGGGTGNAPVGAIDGLFSVSANKQVYFSQGNLQYQASTNTWRFASNQWNYIGDGNTNISSTYSDWIDMFGWGTSGYNHGAVCYQPWSTSTNSYDYYAYGSYSNNLYNNTGHADWGYNAISNGGNEVNKWRTLTKEEWAYVLATRTTESGLRYAKAVVNNVNGLIVLPDDWSANNYDLIANLGGISFERNVISLAVWTNTFAANGAVFLPAAGYRTYNYNYNGPAMSSVGEGGNYWSSSCNNSNNYSYGADYIAFYSSLFDLQSYDSRDFGFSVRLVQDYQ